MEHGAEFVVEIAFAQTTQELVAIHVVANIAVGQIHHLVAVGKVVDRNDAPISARVQSLDEIGADESRGAGDDDCLVFEHRIDTP